MEAFDVPVSPDRRQARKAASRCAFATVLMSAIAYALMTAYRYFCNDLTVGFLGSDDLVLIANMVATNLIAMPLSRLLLLRRLPKEAALLPDAPGRHPLRFKNLLFYLPCVLAVMYAGSMTGRLVGALFGGFHDVIADAVMDVHPLTALLCAVIAAPIAEELFFRKALIDRLAVHHPADAILLSALLFGLMHGNLTQFLYAFPLGVLLGVIYRQTKNIRYTILLHAAVNTFGGLIPLLLNRAGMLETVSMRLQLLYGSVILGLAVVGVVFLIRFRNRFLPIRSDGPRCARLFFVNAGFLVACVVFLSLFVLNEILL